jgi:hypothetical protein
MIGGEEEKIGSWFPETFKVSQQRMEKKFAGRLHTKPSHEETKTGFKWLRDLWSWLF